MRNDVQDDHPGAEELEQRLEAYASARLSPRRGSAARIRVALIEEARMRSLATSIGRTRAAGAGRRRVAVLLLAATLAVAGIASVAAASEAGGPLYGARIWLETSGLPPNADARALGRMHQIEARVIDVETAAQSGDQNAVTAALAAYRAAVDTALTEAGNDPDRLTHLRAALGLHVVVLETLAGRVPDPAMDAIDKAIVSSQKAVDKIDRTKAEHPATGPAATDVQAPTTTPTTAPNPTPKPGRSGQPDSSHGATTTP